MPRLLTPIRTRHLREVPPPTPDPGEDATALRVRTALVGWLGTFVVVSAVWVLFSSRDLVYAFASLGGSSVIVFGMPDSAMSQPRSLFGGHAIGALCGLVFLVLVGTGPWAIGAAVATALVLMLLTDTIHSPAGADPIIVMSGALSLPAIILNLAIGLVLLWLVAILLLNAFRIKPYGRNVPGIGAVAEFIGVRWSARLLGTPTDRSD